MKESLASHIEKNFSLAIHMNYILSQSYLERFNNDLSFPKENKKEVLIMICQNREIVLLGKIRDICSIRMKRCALLC